MVHRASNGVAVLALACALASGCGSTRSETTDGPDMAALGAEEDGSGMRIEKYDLNGDRKPNLWKVYKIVQLEKPDPKTDSDGETKKILVRKDMDLNNDGNVDVRQFVDEQGAITREEMDLDFDGKVDAIVTYRDGKVLKRELDLSLDGRADIVKHYEDGDLVRKERDTNHDGRMDVWEYFEGGRLVRVGVDRDGNGEPEVFDEAPAPPPELPGGAPGG